MNMQDVFQALRAVGNKAIHANDFVWHGGEWKAFDRLDDAVEFTIPIVRDHIKKLKSTHFLMDDRFALTMVWFEPHDKDWMPNLVLGTRRYGMN